MHLTQKTQLALRMIIQNAFDRARERARGPSEQSELYESFGDDRALVVSVELHLILDQIMRAAGLNTDAIDDAFEHLRRACGALTISDEHRLEDGSCTA